MDKNIIVEISRINEIMGTLLITEAIGGFKTIADEILTYVAKKAGKFSNEVTNLIKKLKKATDDNEIIKIISELVNIDDELANIYIPKVMSTITDTEVKQITKLKRAMKSQLESGVPYEKIKSIGENWIDKNVKTSFNGVTDVMKKDLDNYLKSLQKTQTTTPKPKPKNVTDVAGQTLEDVTPLSSKELADLEKLYRQKGLGSSFFKSMRQFAKEVSDMMVSSTTLMDETLSLIKTLSETNNAATKIDIGRRIGDNLTTLTQKEMVNKQIIDEWIDTNVLDYKIKTKIKNLKGYQKAANIYDNTAFREWQKNYNKLGKRKSNLRTQLNSLLNPASWFGESMSKWEGSSKSLKVLNKWKSILGRGENANKFSELRMWVKSGQTQKWSGIREFATSFGWPKAIFNVGKEMLLNYIWLSLGLSLVDYITDLFGNLVRNIPYINEIGVIQDQIKSWDEHVGGKEGENDYYATKGFQITIKQTIAYFIEELSNYHNQFPGLLDELDRFLNLVNTSEVSKESVEKIIGEGNKVKQSLQKKKNVIDNKLDTISSNDIKNVAPEIGYTNDPSGFKEYIKKRFKDNNPVISGTKDVFTYEGVEFEYNNGKFI